MKSGFRKNLSKTAAGLLTTCILMGGGMAEVGGFVGEGIGGLSVSAVSEETPVISFEYEENDDGGITITEFIGNEAEVVIPGKIDGKSVTSIGDWAFYGCRSLTSVEIPDSVTSIGELAFEFCTNLKSAVLSNNLTIIGERAFSSCHSLENIEIPDSVIEIGDGAFSYSGLTGIFIPDSVTIIGETVFEECRDLLDITVDSHSTTYSSIDGVLFNADKTEIMCFPAKKGGSYIIPDGVTKIDSSAFRSCWQLKSVKIPDGVTAINDRTFYDCVNLESVNIPDSVTELEIYAFYHCSSLTSVVIPDNVKIGMGAFENCYSLISAAIPDSVTSIGEDAFLDTALYDNQPDGLVYAGKVVCGYKGQMPENTAIKIKAGTKGIADAAFDGCTGLTSVEIPDGIINIGKGAFTDCINLTDITIPDSVKSIGEDAFRGCSLTKITIPYSVNEIGSDALDIKLIAKGDMFRYYAHDEGFVIYGFSGSAAEAYAYDNCLDFININEIMSFDNFSYFEEFDGILKITSYNGDEDNIIIPSKIDGKAVTTIGNSSLRNCKNLKNVVIFDGVTIVDSCAFAGCTGLTSITIPDTVNYIDEQAFTYEYWESHYDEGYSELVNKKIENLTIYGYSGSYAETYANEMGFAFVAVEEIKDKSSGVEISGKLDSKTKLKINELSVEEIELDEESRQVKVGFDISLLKGKKEVQPEIPVTVKIPYSGATSNIEVYRLNEDGTKDKMIFTFDGSYISFVTDHFSKYIVVGDAGFLGDTNGDGIADIADSLMISRYDAGLITLDDAKVAISDVNNDGNADIADALKIARFDAGMIDSLS